MNFLFEITPDYLIGYKGDEIFRCKLSYTVMTHGGIRDMHINSLPLNAIPYIRDNVKLATDMLQAIYDHASATLTEDKEFDNIKS